MTEDQSRNDIIDTIDPNVSDYEEVDDEEEVARLLPRTTRAEEDEDEMEVIAPILPSRVVLLI